MIRGFQKAVVGYKWPDARVDPDGRTLALLNDPASEGTWSNRSIPSGAPSIIDDDETLSGKAADRARFAEARRDAQVQVGVGPIKAITETANRHGVTGAGACGVTKALIQMRGRTELRRTLVGRPAEQFPAAGDVQVAHALRSFGESSLIRYPMRPGRAPRRRAQAAAIAPAPAPAYTRGHA